MSELTIKTNNVPRLIIDGYYLTAAERQDFDYLDWEGIDGGTESADFFRYRGELYDLSQFSAFSSDPGPEFAGWQGHRADSAFSGTLVRYTGDDHVIVGRFWQ